MLLKNMLTFSTCRVVIPIHCVLTTTVWGWDEGRSYL